MYERYWGLTESPFLNTIDDRWYYESPTHEEAVSRLFYLTEQQRRCGLLLGPAGAGKTLLLTLLEKQIVRTQRQFAAIDVLGMRGDELVWELAAALKLAPSRRQVPPELWRALADHFRGLRAAQIPTVLVFDHLERASSECMRTVERLMHLDTGPACLITTIIATRTVELGGISTLFDDMSDLRIDLSPLGPRQTEAYVRQLLRRAGCEREIFDGAALEALHRYSDGVPRDINRLCDLCLLAGMGRQETRIGESTLTSASAELLAETPHRRHPLVGSRG